MTDLRRPLLLLASGGFISGLSIRMAEPLLPKVAEDFGVSVGAASSMITGFMLAYGLFQLVHGPLGDRVGKLRAVMVSMWLAAAASAGCALAGSLESLALLRFLTGMTSGAVIPLSFAFIGDRVPFAERQAVLARFIGGLLLGQTLGPLVGGTLSDLVGWRATFVVPAAAYLVVALGLWSLARHDGPSPDYDAGRGVLSRYLDLCRRPAARTICLAVAIEGFLFYGAFAYLGAYLRLEFALGFTTIGLVLAGFGLGGIAYSVMAKTLVDRLGPARMVRTGGWLLLGGFAAIAVVPSWSAVVPAVLVQGLAFYLLHNTLQFRATEMAPEARGSAISAFAFCLFFGQALGVVTIGACIAALGYRVAFGLTGVALAALALWFARRLRTL